MRKLLLLLGISAAALTGAALAQGANTLPIWAYPVTDKAFPAPDPAQARHLPGSKVSFTRAGVNDRFNAPDWYPDSHAKMPDVVAHGRKPGVFACGYCHLPNGQGRPENASLAGQPAAYIVQQVADMRTGRRKSSSDKMGSINAMMAVAKASNDAEVKIAAEYFSRLKYGKWIRVVEADRVPKTAVGDRNMMNVLPGPKEAIGKRILEVPVNLERTEWRDSKSGFIAYVPKGSIARGKALVESGAGAFPCAACHGPDYKGNGAVPALAGRSPAQIVRQLYDFKAGTRNGPGAAMMKPEVANMTDDMRVDIAAYLASLNP
ncbi:MAG: c-type cytochrome [Alphaproteobacteria bacterium]|nr:c-type cytochrome [Alphaproteobacteria bacterium]